MKRGSKVTGWCLVSLLSCASADSTVAAADTLGRLRQEQVLNLGFMEGFAPFSSGSDQAPEGYSIDLCQAVVARIRELPGLAGLQVRWHSLAEPEAVRAVGNGQVDLLCTPMVETKTRRGTLDFSIPVFTSGLAALVRRDAPASLLSPLSGSTDNTGPRWRATINAGLSKHSFAVLRGTLSSRWAHERIRQLGLQSTLEEVSTYEEGVQRVADRKVDAFLGDRVVLLAHQARQAERDQLWVPDHLFVMSRVALSMPRGDVDFRLLVDTALSQALSGPQGEGLFVRYLGPQSAQDRLLQSLYPLPD
ncbi:transporter substrate-binding domain-containing protein [Pseudomonas asiatica]|uniref:transporter substrate-binding domain-containing protein n=1 Tax=Pseudomonas asiatica TaxID=2219225 RepID=UPI001E5BC94A|nr:transporter substrate-binding domain-containing protein [Pseudomonas asiatica]MCE0850097.1 transporter substrate-binding domain-containing protein [Pseudomonas asiatica]